MIFCDFKEGARKKINDLPLGIYCSASFLYVVPPFDKALNLLLYQFLVVRLELESAS